MADSIKVICDNLGGPIRVAMGTPLSDVAARLTPGRYPFLAAFVNNRIKEFNYKIYTPVTVRFVDITDFAGIRVYQRTSWFILQKAARTLFPGHTLHIRHSMGQSGFYCELEGLDEFTHEQEFLRENPFVDEVTLLNHGQRTLDLRGTSIRKLMLDMAGLQELWLGEETEQLLFQNKGPDACTIHAPEDGSGLTLQFIGEYRPHTELPNLRGLHGIELKDFDLTGLAAVHPHLKELRLWGAPGNLGNFSAIGGFRELTNLSTFDLFGFGADDIPTPEQMPELRWFWMTSLPETAAKAAKQLWKSKPGMDLRITKPRKPEWLAQNLDNPFRGWDGAEHIPAAAAKKAANQYRKTRSQLMKLAAEPGEDAQAQALDAVTAYTQTFNKMGFIETEERDEIYMALRGILDALPGDTLQKDSLIEKFDELRDF